MKLDYKKTMLVGLGFFTVSLVWTIYNVAVPLYLKEFALSGAVIGFIMALDNIFAVVFQPIFGTLSDRTNTRYGRRMPYLLVGIPLAAISFFIIPFTRQSLPLLMIAVIFLNFFMSVYRSPAVALMPDLTPRALRSKANGIINFMGGLGTAIAYLVSWLLFKMGEFYPYVTVAGAMIITIIVMYNFIKEPETPVDDAPEEQKQKGEHDKGKTLSLVFLLLAIFFWFTGFNAIETFFSTYGEAVLGVDKSVSSQLLLSVSVLFLIFAMPAGIVSRRFGRKNTILTGLCLFIFTCVSLIFIKKVAIMYFLLGLGGISWALININSYPMVVEMTSSGGVGKYTGYYYLFSMLAAIISPILYGFLADMLGDGFLFIYAAVALVIALFFMMLVKHGEAPMEEKKGFENLEHMES